MKQALTKAIKFLIQWDTIWSAPLAFIALIASGALGVWFFGESFATYDASFLQALIIAALIFIVFNGVAWAGIFINFKPLYDYYLNDLPNEFKTLPIWVKVLSVLLLYCFVILVLLVLYLHSA